PTPAGPVNATTRPGEVGCGRLERRDSSISPRAARLSRRARACLSFCLKPSSKASSMAGLAPLSQKVHDLGQSRARPKDSCHAHFSQLSNVSLRDDATDENTDVF